jgi:hypothetical protein
MSEVLEHLRSINLRMDVVWTHLLDKPESSGEKNLDDHVPEFMMRKDKNLVTDTATGGYTPKRTQSPFSGQRFLQQEHGGTPRFEGHTFQERPDQKKSRMDDAAKRVRVDVPDYHGKFEPRVFQDWLTFLEDYFDWSGLSLDRQVRFAKMKLKGQARIWWHSVEEHLHRLKQSPINNWDKMKLKLQEKYLPLDYEDSFFEELILLRQGNMTMDEYVNKFHELSIRSQIAEIGG